MSNWYVGLLVLAIAAPVHAGSSSVTLTVSATVVRPCTTTLDNTVYNCTQQSLNNQSNLSGSARITTNEDGTPMITFVGPQPTVDQHDNVITVAF